MTSKILSIFLLSLFALSTYTQWVGPGIDTPTYGGSGCPVVPSDEIDVCMLIALEVNQCPQITLSGCQDLIPITPEGYCTYCEDVCNACLLCGENTGPACCQTVNYVRDMGACVNRCAVHYGEYGCGTPIN